MGVNVQDGGQVQTIVADWEELTALALQALREVLLDGRPEHRPARVAAAAIVFDTMLRAQEHNQGNARATGGGERSRPPAHQGLFGTRKG